MKTPIYTRLFIIFMMVCASQVQAQSTLTIGPKAGVNLCTLTDVNNPEMQTRFSGGIFALYSAWEHFGVSADVVYVGKGAKFTRTIPDGFGGTTVSNHDLKLHYLEVPIMANFFLTGRGAPVRPKIVVGPAFSFLLDHSETGTPTTGPFNTFDFGAAAGLGVNIDMAPNIWLNFDARYSYSFLSLSDSRDVMNQGIGLMLGLGFGIGE